MFAGIYRDFAGKLECGDFKFTGIYVIITCTLQGMFCDTALFMGGKFAVYYYIHLYIPTGRCIEIVPRGRPPL